MQAKGPHTGILGIKWAIPWNEQKQFGFLTVISMLREELRERERQRERPRESGNKAKQFLIVTAFGIVWDVSIRDVCGMRG